MVKKKIITKKKHIHLLPIQMLSGEITGHFAAATALWLH